MYILDGALSKVLRYTIVDPAFSVDLGRAFTGGAFVDRETVAAVAENKSFVILKENDRADARRNYRYFLESFDRFDEAIRSRLSTVRAKGRYVMSLGYDPASHSLYAVTVPNSNQRRLVVSRFDRKDLMLSEECSPVLAPAAAGRRGNG